MDLLLDVNIVLDLVHPQNAMVRCRRQRSFPLH